MEDDPTMKDVRETRSELSKEVGYDLGRLVHILKVKEENRKFHQSWRYQGATSRILPRVQGQNI